MRCNGYDDPRFFNADGTLKIDPEHVFDTLDEYVAWINHDADGFVFVVPPRITTIQELGAFLDACCAHERESFSSDEDWPA